MECSGAVVRRRRVDSSSPESAITTRVHPIESSRCSADWRATLPVGAPSVDGTIVDLQPVDFKARWLTIAKWLLKVGADTKSRKIDW
jgi:hypothetical protein